MHNISIVVAWTGIIFENNFPRDSESASFLFILPSSPNHHRDQNLPQGAHHPEIPGYADLDQQGDLLTSFGSIDMAGLANHTSDFIGGFFGELLDVVDVLWWASWWWDRFENGQFCHNLTLTTSLAVNWASWSPGQWYLAEISPHHLLCHATPKFQHKCGPNFNMHCITDKN